MSERRRLGLLGGTFDPIHVGHLDAADAARRSLALSEVWLLPSHVPPHRAHEPVASAFHRFALASLAISQLPGYAVSDLELLRVGRTYTIDTLRDLQTRGWAASQLFFILGSDAFAEIATWREYPDVLDAANFIVITRPGVRRDDVLARTAALAGRFSTAQDMEKNGPDTRIIMLEVATRDVSSTDIRRRILAGEPVDGLVPEAVARHILANHLYEAVDDLHGESTGPFNRERNS